MASPSSNAKPDDADSTTRNEAPVSLMVQDPLGELRLKVRALWPSRRERDLWCELGRFRRIGHKQTCGQYETL